MASYGSFITACGFTFNGPEGDIGFAPKLTPENFKAPFTTAEGWGSFSQRVESGGVDAEIALKWGDLRLRSISLATAAKPFSASIEVNGRSIFSKTTFSEGTSTLVLPENVKLNAGDTIHIRLTS
jgi:hypothetical protein